MLQGVSAQGVEIEVRVGERVFLAEVERSATGEAFVAVLPATLRMEELNGNEKYCYVGQTLPSAAASPGTIHAGDIMLYGSSCIVVFYETFSTSYTYTRIGRIADAEGLREAFGDGDVSVGFCVAKSSALSDVRNPKMQGEAYSLSGARATSGSRGLIVNGGRLKGMKNR